MSAEELREIPVKLHFLVSRRGDEDIHILRLAALLPGLRRQEETAVVTLSLEDAATYRDILFDLAERVKDQAGTELSLGGEATDIAGLKQALAIIDCAKCRRASALGDAYCRPAQGWDWGCRHLHHVAPHFDTEEDLLRELDNAAARQFVRYCPFFDRNLMARLAREFCSGHKERGFSRYGRTTAEPLSDPAIPLASYSDIGGLEEVVRQVRESIELPLRHPEVIARLGIASPRGVLLYGPPGCGKTLLARAVAHESGVRFIAVSGPELITKWHGESEDNLRKVFAEAKQKQPCIIFFDEIDAIAQARSAAESLRLDARFTTQLLVLLDGIHDPGKIFVIGTTNRLDLLDPALLRPGRFDRIIAVPRPDSAARLAILNIHARKLPLGADVELAAIANRLGETTGADIAFVVREAAYHCLRRTMGDSLLNRHEPLSDEELARLEVCSEDFDAALHELEKREASLMESSVALSNE
jgi:AAA+ superfamily predicted ATPase